MLQEYWFIILAGAALWLVAGVAIGLVVFMFGGPFFLVVLLFSSVGGLLGTVCWVVLVVCRELRGG